MAAETVISHNVLTSGLFPKNMGWTNEVYRDSANVLGTPGAYYVTSSMSCDEYKKLIAAGQYKKLQDYLDARFGETSAFASIAQKRTSACTSGHTSAVPTEPTRTEDTEDIILQIRGSRRTCPNPAPPGAPVDDQWRQPESGNGVVLLPSLDTVTGGCANRWWTTQRAGAYGTGAISPANIYPLDGNRFVPGFDSAHLGGDIWSADAATKVIQDHPNWRGIMVSLGGIDKLGHMWGPEDRGERHAAPGSIEEMRHLPFIAKTADKQVGKIVKALKDEGALDETLIVITADHAAQTGRPFHGLLAPGVTNPQCSDPPRTPPTAPPSTGIRSDCNWYWGQDADERYKDPSEEVQGLVDALGGETGNLAFSYQDGHVAAWLKDISPAKKQEAAEAVLDMAGVIASYRTNTAQNDYILHGTNRMRGSERRWFESHGEELVDTMAAPNGPDVVGLLKTDVTYGVTGDHGGHNRLIQNIPMVFYGPGVDSKDSSRELRHVDVLPTILEAMGIDYDEDSVDGEGGEAVAVAAAGASGARLSACGRAPRCAA